MTTPEGTEIFPTLFDTDSARVPLTFRKNVYTVMDMINHLFIVVIFPFGITLPVTGAL